MECRSRKREANCVCGKRSSSKRHLSASRRLTKRGARVAAILRQQSVKTSGRAPKANHVVTKADDDPTPQRWRKPGRAQLSQPTFDAASGKNTFERHGHETNAEGVNQRARHRSLMLSETSEPVTTHRYRATHRCCGGGGPSIAHSCLHVSHSR